MTAIRQAPQLRAGALESGLSLQRSDGTARSEASTPNQLHRGVVNTGSASNDGHRRFITVSQLADIILERDQAEVFGAVSSDQTSRSIAQSCSAPTGSMTAVTTPRLSDPGSTTDSRSTAAGISDSQPTLSRPISNFSEPAAFIDGTTLAIALGLPIHYGSQLLHCVDIFFGRVYLTVPVVHEASFRGLLTQPSQLSQVQRSFILALCAAAWLRDACRQGETVNAKAKETGFRFLEQSLSLRGNVNFIEEQTPVMVTTSYFLHLSYACVDMQQSSGHFLREAINFGMGLGLHHQTHSGITHDAELICARRTLALLSVTERAMAILVNVPAILLRTAPALPAVFFDEEDGKILTAFDCLYSLFKLLDPQILDYWSNGRLEYDQHKDHLRGIIENAQKQLMKMSFHDKALTDIQRAAILVTQQWLRLIFWQLSTRLGLLSILSTDPAFSYDYPIQLGKDLCKVLESLPEEALLFHHFSIYCKIFEIAFSLMDILTLAGINAGVMGTHELRVLFRILVNSPVTDMGYDKILMLKTLDRS